jgi:signal peptidase II
MFSRAWPFLLSLAVIALDRASKHWIETSFRAWDVVVIIPGFFQIVHTRNTGIAFGMLGGNGQLGQWLLVAFSLAVMGVVISLLWAASKPAGREHWTLRAALGSVLGGAAGNLYDRIVFGSVTDFLDFYSGVHHFPIFNLADSAITCGAGLLILHLWFLREPGKLARTRGPSIPH